MAGAKVIRMHRHLMNLLPTLLACAPLLFAVAMFVLALTTVLPHLAARANADDEFHEPRRLLIPFSRLPRDGR